MKKLVLEAQLTAFEAGFVVFVSASHTFFSGIDGFFAFGAFWVFYWLERHLGVFILCPGTINKIK